MRQRATTPRNKEMFLGLMCAIVLFVMSEAFSIPCSHAASSRLKSSLQLGPNSLHETDFSLVFASVVPTRGALRKLFAGIVALGKVAAREIKELSLFQTFLFVAVFALGVWLGQVTPFWRRMTSVLDIPTSFFGPTAPFLKGRAVTVSDGDTIRLLHVPTPFSRSVLMKKEKVSEVALPIRLCTIDAPETAKFGKPGQPFGPEAKELLESLVGKKMVTVRLLQKDQYGRAVASIYTGQWPFRKAVDERMLKAGMAEVYNGSGAVYGHRGKDEYLKMENEAKKKKLGIWSQKRRESAAEYKKRTK
mmetsp:Transcript_40048/g.81798  ORF Transcript_40048/g.81798 Transcript_40048/m.81798 type:complete len:304 (-) Transcript_40048:66-977(-)